MSTNQKTVMITGASAGVGRATALEFARRGCRVGLLARNTHALDMAKRQVDDAGGQAMVVPTDVADAGQVQSAVDEIEQVLGSIDVLVNNAMVTAFAPVEQLTAEEFRRITEVNYLGAVNTTLALLSRMLERDRGTIVQVGSALSYQAIPLQAPYCATKFALRGFVDSLRTELRHKRSSVWVTSVHLPALNTPQFTYARTRLAYNPRPVPPTFQPEVAARTIAWAADHRRREVWVGAPTVKTIVGSKLAPGYAERYLAKFGYNAQQTQEPVAENRVDNLEFAVSHDPGVYGPFSSEAKSRSLQTIATRRRRALAVAAAGVVAAVGRRILSAR